MKQVMPPRIKVSAVLALVLGLAAFEVIRTTQEHEVTDTHGQTGLLWSSAVDPSVAPGLAAPTWQLLVRTDVPSMYYKSGTANTSWTLLGSSSAGTGTVTSVACGTNLACSPSPITAAGTVATVAAPTFSGTVTGGSIVTGGNVTASTGIVTGGQVVSSGLATLNTLLVGDSGTDGVITFERAASPAGTIRTFGSDPNGSVSAIAGSLVLDSNGKLWVNTSGSTTWSQVATGGSQLYDTVLLKVFSGPGSGTLTFNDANLGALGQNTLVYTECNNLGFSCNVSGFVGGVAGKTVTVCDDFNSSTTFGISLTDASASASAAANQLWNNGASQTAQHKGSCNTYWYGTWGGRTAWKQLGTAAN